MPSVSIENIPSGFHGTARTIEKMHELIRNGMTDLSIQKIADAIVLRGPKIHDRDYDEKARRIFNFVKDYVRFERDPFGIELLQDAIITLNRRAGDCDDHVCLNAALLGSLGFPFAIKTIKADSARPNEFSHVYLVVNIPKRGWVPFDTSVGHSTYGWEAKGDFLSKLWLPSVD